MPKGITQKIAELEAQKDEIDKQIEALRLAEEIMGGAAGGKVEKKAKKGSGRKSAKKAAKKATKKAAKGKRSPAPTLDWVVETVKASKNGMTKAEAMDAARNANLSIYAVTGLLDQAVKNKKLTKGKKPGYKGKGTVPFLYKAK